MIRILTVDDHEIVREGLKLIINDLPDMTVAGEASNYGEMMDLLGSDDYDIVLLDISLPGLNGLEVLKELKKHRPHLPVLILTMHPEEQYAVRAFKSGAAGYITKDSASDEMVTAIRKVAGGRKYLTASLAEKLVSYLDHYSEKALHENLSDREFEVMVLLAQGEKISAIAAELLISVKTVATYKSRIMEKMGFDTDTELARYALENRLIV